MLKSINPSAATANTVVGIANPSDSQAVNYIGTDGVQHRIAPASGALVLLEQHTASSSASLAFTTCISATYDTYEVTLVDLQTSTNANLEMQVSTDGGSTYDTTSGHYLTSADYTDGTLTTSSTGDGTTTMTWTTGLGSAYIVSGRFSFYNPGSASLAKLAAGMISVWSNTTALFNQRWTNVYKQTTAVNTFRLAASTGTLASGTARCYGIAK